MKNEKLFEEMALMVTRQTDLTLDEAKKKLKENNYDYITVIKNEMGIVKKEKEVTTINQKIYKEIRTLMDDGCKTYTAKQEYIKKMQNNLHNIKKNKQLENIPEKEFQENEENSLS